LPILHRLVFDPQLLEKGRAAVRNRVHLTLFAAALALVAASACNRGDGGADSAAAAEAVKGTEEAMLQAVQARDAAKVASYYAADGVAFTPGDKPIEGNKAIEEFYGRMVGDQAFALDFTNAKTDVSASGDLAYTRGTFRVTYTDPGSQQPVTQAGNYVTIFKKQTDGSWKIVEDINAPGLAEGAAAAESPTG
jgi:uncharacterized protein (TIGR02246 family)